MKPSLQLIKKHRNLQKYAVCKIIKTQTIPKQLKNGKIEKYWEYKKEKEKRESNERGITLTSNLGKLLGQNDQIINDQIKGRVRILGVWTGGGKHSALVDHILELKEPMTYKQQNNNKCIHKAFLDVTKTYDKAINLEVSSRWTGRKCSTKGD